MAELFISCSAGRYEGTDEDSKALLARLFDLVGQAVSKTADELGMEHGVIQNRVLYLESIEGEYYAFYPEGLIFMASQAFYVLHTSHAIARWYLVEVVKKLEASLSAAETPADKVSKRILGL